MKAVILNCSKTYNDSMSRDEVYNIAKGCWTAKMQIISDVNLVLVVANKKVVCVFKPKEWLLCNCSNQTKSKIHFTVTDLNEERDNHYLNKKLLMHFQNPVKYFNEEDEIWEK
ncbi:hypothetical protein [Spiroplasma cantharicola]|uniref:Uncharacterized protein n=1 Tax=Spiroplasma cantharicola TaxID=362837 RepID=A0A0M4JSH4_9MOLU|nr:hypothetical protein [Spiroplasma cantharicola]ALD66333.1 hypothetical protein SCANT_v1c04270 [Spiroplasma cantharicola]